MNKPFIYIFCFFLILALNSFGQNEYLFNMRQLSAKDGMLGRRVHAILDDADGFMWIATNEGLNRFDGYRFEHYTKASHGLNANNIKNISIDDENDIWITYNEDKFIVSPTQIFRPRENRMVSFQEKFGNQYKAVFDSIRLGNNSLTPPISFNTPDLTNYIYTKGKAYLFSPSHLMENKQTGELWFNEKNFNFYKTNLKGEKLDSVGKLLDYEKKNLNILRSGSFMVYGRANAEENVLSYKNVNSSDYIEVAKYSERTPSLHLHDGFWIDGVIYFEFENQMISYDISDISKRKPRHLYADAQNNIWIGMNEGIILLSVKKQNFRLYLKNAGKNKDNSVYDGRGIWADNKNMFAFSGSGAYQYDFETKNKKLLFAKKRKQFNSNAVIQARDGNLWMGTKNHTLHHIDKETGENLASFSGTKGHIWSILEDKNGRIWLGQNKYGLHYIEPDKMQKLAKYTQINGFEEVENIKVIHFIENQRDNNWLLLGAQSGWYHLHIKDGIQRRYWSGSEPAFNIPAVDIHFTYQDDDNNYWLGTASSGLVKVRLQPNFEVEAVEQFTIEDGLTSNTIYAVFEDENGYLWMSSNNGIMRFDKKTHEVQAFLEEDGLPHYEFNRISHFQRADGTIFFGTLNGIVSFHPKELKSNVAFDVPVKIVKCEKYSDEAQKIINITTDVFQKNKITIHPSDRLVTLYVSLQDYSLSSKTKYAYRVKGLEEAFNLIDKNEITLSGLPYGRFILEIKAKNYDGHFSTDMISIPVVILRPFYLTWWFVLLFLLGAVLAGYQILQARTRFLQSKKLELEEVVKARTQQLQLQATQLQEQATQLQIDKNTIENQAKELRSLDKMKSQFFANISHELRTPLTLILSPIRSVLKRRELNNRDFTSAQMVEQNAQKLLKRINEILDLTKLEAQAMELKPLPTPFYEFNKRLVATFESLAVQKDQKLTFKYQLDKDLNLMLDQDKYEHIFNNYLSNAIKFTPKSGIIHIELSEQKLKNANDTIENYIQLSINDNGIGIHSDDLPKVFNRFYQTKNNKNGTGGSGIGLALSKEIAFLMKGKTYVKSTVGKGSTFYFEMPYVETVANYELPVASYPLAVEKIIVEDIKEPVTLNSQLATILLVEDNPQLRNYIQIILQEKYNVVTAENGKMALDILNDSSSEATVYGLPSAVISDIMMPVMDGFELLKQLKSSDAFDHIPVVMLTARSNIKDKLNALRIGVDDYILKPFQEEELLARIDNLIMNAKSRVITETNGPSTNKKGKSTTNRITEADHKWLEQIEKRLKEEISNSKFNVETLNVETLSEEMGISRSKLQRRIKKITGLTPVQYFRDIKLQAARELLESQQVQTINEVAYAVGFDTPAYFSKVFTKHFGKKPIEYLK